MSSPIYRPLEHSDSIRLLLIIPGTYDDRVACELFHTRLSANFPYCALSYAGGEILTDLVLENVALAGQRNWTSIDVKYESPDSPPSSFVLDIGLNLLAALRRLRDLWPGVALWIDSICIDHQPDKNEKNHQVAMMADIYKNASLVIAWLGEETESDRLAFETLRNFNKTDAESFLNPGDTIPPFIVRHGLNSSSQNQYSDAWRALVRLFTRNWFYRVWCVQEFCLASVALHTGEPVMLCGSQQLDWRYFGLLSQQLGKPIFGMHILADITATIEMLWLRDTRASAIHTWRRGSSSDNPSADHETLHLLSLLITFAERDASLKVDKIFALLNMANDVRDPNGKLILMPDYNKSELEVQLDLSAFIIRRDGNLHILSYLAGYDRTSVYVRRSTPQMASWVPDWCYREVAISRSMIHGIWAMNIDKFCPSGKDGLQEAPTTDGIYLQSHGCCVGMISQIFPSIRDYKSTPYDEFCESIINIIRVCFAALVPHATQREEGKSSEEFLSRFWRTVSVDRPDVIRHWCKHFNVSSVGVGESTKFQLSRVNDVCEVPDEHIEFANTIRMAHWDRRLFITESGYLGLGPTTAQLKDSVYILQTARTPFVLRPTTVEVPSHSLGTFTVVGEAFVDGIMYGEMSKGGEGVLRWSAVTIL